MEVIVAILVLAAVVCLVGSVCGMFALGRISALEEEVRHLRLQVRAREEMPRTATPAPEPVRPESAEIPAPGVSTEERGILAASAPPPLPKEEPAPPSEEAPAAPAASTSEGTPLVSQEERAILQGPGKNDFEVALGTRWLAYSGLVLLIVALAFFLNYLYEIGWLSEERRLASGVIAGFVALGLGERFRRKNWPALFQTLTGGGLAAFYVCIYFSFQVYGFIGASLAMGLAVCVTLLAIAMAVIHNAVAIAILGLIGGYLSPVLLSTGENRPHALFIYVAILNLAAMGTAYFRRWRALNLLCFVGMAILYALWREKFYDETQMTLALAYASIFYLMFLVIPALQGLLRRVSADLSEVVLIAGNAAFSAQCYFQILFEQYRHAFGYVILAQAALLLLLGFAWLKRMGKRTATFECLLAVALTLVTSAVPILLEFRAVPVAWAAKGALLVYLGIRFRHLAPRVFGCAAFLLAGLRLLQLLPLHEGAFTFVFNAPFGSWVWLAVCCFGAFYLLTFRNSEPHHADKALKLAVFVLGCVVCYAAATFEVVQYWTVQNIPLEDRHAVSSAMLLWSCFLAVSSGFVWHYQRADWIAWPLLTGVPAFILFLVGFEEYDLPADVLALNSVFLSRLAFTCALLFCAASLRRAKVRPAQDIVEIVGHLTLMVLLGAEFHRWGEFCEAVSSHMSISLVSVAWAIHAFALIWLGLATRNRIRRILGFCLLGLTVGKVCLYDTSVLERVYQILSFLASGLFCIIAAYFYNRYKDLLLRESNAEATSIEEEQPGGEDH